MLKKIIFTIFMSMQFYLYAQAFHNIGEDYFILQYRVNVREEPSINSNVIAILSLHDRVQILENLRIYEKINGADNVWYKIKFGNITGYIFGGNIALKALVTDIDNNGINDYFYFRFSNYVGIGFNPCTDVFIYINNKRINTDILRYSRYQSLHFDDYDDYHDCNFQIIGDYVLITLSRDVGNYGFSARWKVYGDGSIEFLDSGY